MLLSYSCSDLSAFFLWDISLYVVPPGSQARHTIAVIYSMPAYHCYLLSCDAGPSNLACYTGINPSSAPITIQKTPFKNADGNYMLCASYSFLCTANDMRCTAEEIRQHAYKQGYTIVSLETCGEMQAEAKATSGTIYSDVSCCIHNLCNKPWAVLKPASVAGPRTITESPNCDIAVMDYIFQRSGITSGAPDGLTKSLDVPLKCYTGYIPSIDGSKVTVVEYPKGPQGGYDLCASYQFRCTADDKACTAEESARGIYKWGFLAVTREMCEQMKAAGAGVGQSGSAPLYKSVTCCGEDLCNMPDY